MTIGQQFFFGAGEPRITLTNQTIPASALDPADATAAYTLEADGDVSQSVNGTPTDLGDWIAPKVGLANYEVFATLNSGSLTAGTTGSWVDLTLGPTWVRNRTTVGSAAANITVQIRRKFTTTVLASATISLTADVDP